MIALWQVLLNHDGADFLSNTIYKPLNLDTSFLNARSTEALFSIFIAVEKRAVQTKFGQNVLQNVIQYIVTLNDSRTFRITVKPRFTGPLGGKKLGPVNREARYIGVHFTLIYT